MEEIKREKKIFEASELPLEDKVYFRKDKFGWKQVYPIKNPDGSYNWPNLLFGGYRNLIFLIILIVVALFGIWLYHIDITNIENHYAAIAKDPLLFCKNYKAGNVTFFQEYNLTEIDLTPD